jgi:hypothetical protein
MVASLVEIANNYLEGSATLNSARSVIYTSTTTEDSISIPE